MTRFNFSSKLTPGFDVSSRLSTQRSRRSPTRHFWSQSLNQLVGWMTQKPEPRVWRKPNQQGHMQWHAYDPQSDRSFVCDTETEMRRWIEQTYHQPSPTAKDLTPLWASLAR
ncbi:hypothetical protein ACQ4M4_23385 [Leptolyngbya sp. AN02str]|uniref:hypothetical protein n=1 Tax=Leptolyngbya sp. AN02str TaxID=3423363 RepID=UPI003D31E5FA